jgi:branched-chain amino acid transport system ATP-binding protein
MSELGKGDPARLEVTDLHAGDGDNPALQGCSLVVGQECVAVLGRAGAGKTTLLRAIMGLTPPASGSIRWRGQEIAGKKPFVIANLGIGYVPQGQKTFPSLTVEEHLIQAYRKTGVAHAWTPKRVFDLFPELADRRRLGGSRLSADEQQMLAIGRALAANPGILLLDDPSEGLTPAAVERVAVAGRALLKASIAVLLVERNIQLAGALAGRVVILVDGRTAYESGAASFLENPDLRQQYLGV